MDCIIGDPDNFRGSVGSGIRSSAPASHPLLCTGGSGGKRFTLKAQALHLIPDPLHQLIIGIKVKLMDLGSVEMYSFAR